METNPLDDVDDISELDSYIQEREFGYEDRVVKKIMDAHGLSDHINHLRHICEERTGERWLKLGHFNDIYLGYPVKLAAKRVKYLQKISLTDLFKRFTTTSIVKEYMSFVEDLGEDFHGCCGIVFMWYGLDTMVLHNYIGILDAETLNTQGTLLVRSIGKRLCILESFSSFVARVSLSWHP